jgi:serine/threonine-protein kinase
VTDLATLRAALADRYTLERELGRGGMATVYLAQDAKLGRPVALKVLRPELAAALGPERFLREITVTAGLDHPHILPLLDSGEAAGFLFYTMPYVEGESLRDRLAREKQLPLEDALQVAREVADALGYAHSRGIIHRDIKPENILLAGGHARVADFGIARAIAVAGTEQLTETGLAVGTPAYMSPEQGAGSRELDGRSDLYSLGCVLYEMLSGETPYLGHTPQAILAKKLTEPAPRVSVIRETVPPGIDDALRTVLARTPADRFATASQFVDALRGDGPIRPARVQPWWRSRPFARLVIGGAALAVLATLGRLVLGRPGSLAVVIEHAVPVTTDPVLEIDPALSPDGAFVAYAAGPLLATRIYVRQLGGGRPIAIGDSGGTPQRWPRWSADGTRLLFVAGHEVMEVPALGGRARPLVRATALLWGADWSPDGTAIVFIAGDSLYVAGVAAGGTRALGGFDDPHSPTWSPDSRAIAFVSGNSAYVHWGSYGNSAVSTVNVVPATGGEAVSLTDGRSLAVSPAWLPDGKGLLFISDRGGPRDVYRTSVRRTGRDSIPPARVTTGLRPHSITLSRDGRRLGYNIFVTSANIWSVPVPAAGTADARAATPLTRGSQVIETLTISADGRWVYYDSDRSGRPELYRVPTAGGEPQQLTDAPGRHYWPIPSPDGRELAFQAQRYGSRDLFVMPAEGGAAIPIRVGPGTDNVAQWFPDGQRIGFSHNGGGLPNGWYVTEKEGGGWSAPRRAIGIPTGIAGFLSPDTREVLLDRTTALETVSLVDSTTRVRYAKRSEDDPTVRLARYRPDGGIVFLGQAGGRRGIYALPPGGGTAREILRFDDPWRQPVFGGFDTDGRRLYFTMDEAQSDLWVADLRSR